MQILPNLLPIFPIVILYFSLRAFLNLILRKTTFACLKCDQDSLKGYVGYWKREYADEKIIYKLTKEIKVDGTVCTAVCYFDSNGKLSYSSEFVTKFKIVDRHYCEQVAFSPISRDKIENMTPTYFSMIACDGALLEHTRIDLVEYNSLKSEYLKSKRIATWYFLSIHYLKNTSGIYERTPKKKLGCGITRIRTYESRSWLEVFLYREVN